MQIEHIRAFRDVVNQHFKAGAPPDHAVLVSAEATAAIDALEESLGLPLFERDGERLLRLSRDGLALLPIVHQVGLETDKLLNMAAEFRRTDAGRLVVATAHTQSRYMLPQVVRNFRERYPEVDLALHQASPERIIEMVANGSADIGICSEGLDRHPNLLSFPAYQWQHCALVPEGHPLATGHSLAIEDLARFPIVTYDSAFAGRSRIDAAFRAAGLIPNVVLTAIDADVIKTYVEIGLGVGIVNEMAYDPVRDPHLVQRSTRHIFPPNLSRVAIRRGGYLRPYAEAFIRETVQPAFREQLRLPRAPGSAPVA